MPPDTSAPAGERPFDLEERSARFGEEVIRFLKSVKPTAVTTPLITQTVRAATSIGANYGEADGSVSVKEFKHKIAIARREARETMHWMRMLAAACPDQAPSARALWKEARELMLILSAIYRS